MAFTVPATLTRHRSIDFRPKVVMRTAAALATSALMTGMAITPLWAATTMLNAYVANDPSYSADNELFGSYAHVAPDLWESYRLDALRIQTDELLAATGASPQEIDATTLDGTLQEYENGVAYDTYITRGLQYRASATGLCLTFQDSMLNLNSGDCSSASLSALPADTTAMMTIAGKRVEADETAFQKVSGAVPIATESGETLQLQDPVFLFSARQDTTGNGTTVTHVIKTKEQRPFTLNVATDKGTREVRFDDGVGTLSLDYKPGEKPSLAANVPTGKPVKP